MHLHALVKCNAQTIQYAMGVNQIIWTMAHLQSGYVGYFSEDAHALNPTRAIIYGVVENHFPYVVYRYIRSMHPNIQCEILSSVDLCIDYPPSTYVCQPQSIKNEMYGSAKTFSKVCRRILCKYDIKKKYDTTDPKKVMYRMRK
jgi:hypothetical protein